MNETYRHKQLLSLLEEKRMLSTNEIINLLEISPATARRDITGRRRLNQTQGDIFLAKSIMSAKNSVLPKQQVNTVLMVQA